jgi:hypothetical protein
MSDPVSINGVVFPDSNPTECSGQGGEEPQANREGNMKDDLVDYKVDPYKEALCNLTEGR